MTMKKLENPKLAVGRRDFFKGTAASAAALVAARGAGGALVRGAGGGGGGLALGASGAGTVEAHGGRSYTLTASQVDWPVGGGMTAHAWAYSVGGGDPTVPGPTLRAREGERLHIRVG